jgi:16S rRNA (uracil1498-N3)-methyltransferase
MPRFYCPEALQSGDLVDLPPSAARHVQVLRMQPGEQIILFNGSRPGTGLAGGEFEATITRMGRRDVQVRIGKHNAVERHARREVHLALGMPANDRMDWLVEKATELGVASIQPLMTERSVLRLQGERADKKLAHWISVAVAACEQCGANQLPLIHPVLGLSGWLKTASQAKLSAKPLLLSLQSAAKPLGDAAGLGAVLFLSGPEGGLTPAEEEQAFNAGFAAVTLGPRVLRAETAALAALAALTLPR